MEYRKPFLIGEIGCNHKGDVQIAKDMISTASIFCKSDAVKFQKRCNKELLTNEEYNSPHPVPQNAYGETYGEHRENLEFTLDQHRELKDWCSERGIIYSSSVWDLTSAQEIASLAPEFIKVPSACNQNKPLISYLCDDYGGEIHISLGMTTIEEESRLIEYIDSKGRAGNTVIYACTSGYPTPFEELYLLEIQRLVNDYSETVKSIGFSGHHLGIAVDSAAYTLGAQYIERHFTLDRTWKGTDHSASLEPDGLRRVTRDLNALYKSLKSKSKEILDIEKMQRDKLKKNQIIWDNINS